MKRDSKILVYCFLMCLFSAVIVYWLINMQMKKTGVVDAVRLFNEYNMKKELESKAKVQLQALNSQLDTIRNKVEMAHAMKDTQQQKALLESYEYFKTKLENKYTKSNQEINAEVWKRLNALVEEYGKKRHLHLIIGANGMGSVLYNDDYYDMTNDLINYANKEYEGK